MAANPPVRRYRRYQKKDEDRPENDFKKYPKTNIEIPLITREKWFGLIPNEKQFEVMTGPHTQVCFVPTETSPCVTTKECLRAVPEIQKRNMLFRSWPDIPYNFLIGGDGYVYEGRGWLYKYKDHGSTAMQEALQIGYIGHYKNADPPKEMVDLGLLLVEYGKKRKLISEDYTYIECPLKEYFQYAPTLEAHFASDAYQDFLKTIPKPRPAAPPPPPPSEPPAQPSPPSITY